MAPLILSPTTCSKVLPLPVSPLPRQATFSIHPCLWGEEQLCVSVINVLFVLQSLLRPRKGQVRSYSTHGSKQSTISQATQSRDPHSWTQLSHTAKGGGHAVSHRTPKLPISCAFGGSNIIKSGPWFSPNQLVKKQGDDFHWNLRLQNEVCNIVSQMGEGGRD